MASIKRVLSICIPVSLALCGCAPKAPVNVVSTQQWQQATNKVHQKYSEQVEQRLEPYFSQANLSYPPQKIAMLAFKKEQLIELWAQADNQQWHHIKDYPLTAFSGRLGPKLKRNDGQIPEGIYKITRFNPYSSQHLSLMLNYPNAFDKQYGQLDGRYDLGDNIFIHGKSKSVGCLAVGDQAIDDLFILVKEVGKHNTQVIIAPNDLRKQQALAKRDKNPRWLPKLYQQIASKLAPFSAQT